MIFKVFDVKNVIENGCFKVIIVLGNKLNIIEVIYNNDFVGIMILKLLVWFWIWLFNFVLFGFEV